MTAAWARNLCFTARIAVVLNKTLKWSLLGRGGGPIALALVWFAMYALAAPVAHLADANDPTKVEWGRHNYRLYYSSGHGRALQGQPLWQRN